MGDLWPHQKNAKNLSDKVLRGLFFYRVQDLFKGASCIVIGMKSF
ncbi:hypothetical protein JOD43_003716 [Pullulanibacillus pueri]|nr:hypothetical protein [Pullulanibacillus pueri]